MNFQKELLEAGYKSIILLRNEMGAGKPGAGSGAEVLASVLLENEESKELRLIQSTIRKRADSKLMDFPAKYIDQMEQIAIENAALIEEGLQHGPCFILSGDHSNAAGSIAGLVKANPHAKVGVIWIDAHADLHTPFTTPSGNFHGMPLAALLGIESEGKNSQVVSDAQSQMWHQYLTVSGKKPAIQPSNLVYIAVRSTEPEEDTEILNNDILQISVSELKESGVKSVIDKALQYLESCDIIYISFDIDSLDSSIVSGTGTPVVGGLSVDEAIQLLRSLVFHPKTKAFEITEVNPSLDIKPQSVIETATHIIHQIFKK